MFQSVEVKVEKEPVVIPVGKERLFGTIHRPESSVKGPAVLYLHGFASSRTGKYRLSYDVAEKLAAGGTTVLRIDLRGCGDSDGSFEEMTISTQVADCQAALAFLRSDPRVDGERIGLLGRSLGAAIAVECGRCVKSLGLWVPFFNAAQWVDRFSKLPKGHPILIDGNVPGRGFLEEISKFSLAGALGALTQVPILHIHSKKDQILDRSHLDNYLEARGSCKELDRLVILEEADHYFSRPEDRKLLINETVAWFEETL